MRPFYSHAGQFLLESAVWLGAQRRLTRRALNLLYERFSLEQKQAFYDRYSKIFRRRPARLQPGTWKIVVDGHRIDLPLSRDRAWLDWDSALSLVGHDFEVKRTYLRLLLSRERPDLFVDIGANYGTHSLLFLVFGVPVLSFEPNVSCHDYFHESCALNRLQGRMEAIALADSVGPTFIRYPESATWLGSTQEHVQRRVSGSFSLVEQSVDQRRLDDYPEILDYRNVLIKIDTEGSELAILKGARRVLAARTARIIFECTDKSARGAIYALLSDEMGYLIHHLPWDPEAGVPLSAGSFCDDQGTNFIAVPGPPTG